MAIIEQNLLNQQPSIEVVVKDIIKTHDVLDTGGADRTDLNLPNLPNGLIVEPLDKGGYRFVVYMYGR